MVLYFPWNRSLFCLPRFGVLVLHWSKHGHLWVHRSGIVLPHLFSIGEIQSKTKLLQKESTGTHWPEGYWTWTKERSTKCAKPNSKSSHSYLLKENIFQCSTKMKNINVLLKWWEMSNHESTLKQKKDTYPLHHFSAWKNVWTTFWMEILCN